MWETIRHVIDVTKAVTQRLATSSNRVAVAVSAYLWRGRRVSKSQVERHAAQFEPHVRKEICRLMEWSEGRPLVAFYEAMKHAEPSLQQQQQQQQQQQSFVIAMAIADSPFCGLERRQLRSECEGPPHRYVFSSGSVPIILAAQANRLDVLAALIAKGADVNAIDDHYRNALGWTVINTNAAAAELLLFHGADASNDSSNEKSGFTAAIHIAAKTGPIHMLHLLRSKGVSIHARNNLNQTPLHLSALYGRAVTAKFLILNGAAIEVLDHVHNTPLHLAADNGRVEVAQILLAYGADVGAVNKNRATPLHTASVQEEFQMIQMLLDSGADIDARSEGLQTPLFIAAHTGDIACIKVLVAEGASLTAADSSGDTPLQAFDSGCDIVFEGSIEDKEHARRLLMATSHDLMDGIQ